MKIHGWGSGSSESKALKARVARTNLWGRASGRVGFRPERKASEQSRVLQHRPMEVMHITLESIDPEASAGVSFGVLKSLHRFSKLPLTVKLTPSLGSGNLFDSFELRSSSAA